MKRPVTRAALILFVLAYVVWSAASIRTNIEAGTLLEFGTAAFRTGVTESAERAAYAALAENAIARFIAYPLLLLGGIVFVATSELSFRQNGWLLMSAILLFVFVPVELYCCWLDWRLVGLQYWGPWPIEEFRKTLLARVTALAGLPFIAQLCYFTIPILALVRPLRTPTGR